MDQNRLLQCKIATGQEVPAGAGRGAPPSGRSAGQNSTDRIGRQETTGNLMQLASSLSGYDFVTGTWYSLFGYDFVTGHHDSACRATESDVKS
ncbi:hypothetical protein L2E82_28500 [Cichorium intybus]|uniref:Uncharacterized protein n=1 Tax=Cichorium intybus TaxID=13427 RepID=A0ACB9CWC7_CICIN|nr:hypothetical protein L2E82_28500 [Cichorium intybus]